MNQKELAKQIIRNKDVRYLAKKKFNFNLTPTQEEIVRKIVFRECKRMFISAMTRWGKTQIVSIAVSLLIQFSKGLKVVFIGPKEAQASIIRNYLTELLVLDQEFYNLADIDKSGTDKIKKEASRKRMTFKNDCEYRVFSAEGDAARLMGWGGTVIVVDEASLIPENAWAKILRMLGDNPDEAMLIELCNPWTKDNRAYEHSLDPDYDVYHVDYRTAIEEGRTTKKHIEKMRSELTPIEFTVLYESLFPDQGNDSIFDIALVQLAIERDVPEWCQYDI